MSIISAIVLLTSAFFLYVSDYYKAENPAVDMMKEADNIEVRDNLTIISPESPGDTALIFYPGAKVEHIAYIPMLEKLSKNGITCVLVKMPFNMAIFSPNEAEKVFDELPGIENWYIGGHSMGGAMASSYAAKNLSKIKGLILLGAYIYGDVPPKNALTIYGTFNSSIEDKIDYTENIVIIEGGNHAQFGNYGQQRGDPPATISSEKQQDIAVEAIMEFIIEKTKE